MLCVQYDVYCVYCDVCWVPMQLIVQALGLHSHLFRYRLLNAIVNFLFDLYSYNRVQRLYIATVEDADGNLVNNNI